MQGDVVLARGGQKDPTDEDARGSRKKSYFVPALKGADPQIRPRSLTFPSRPAGGPAGPARSLAPWTAAPTAPPPFSPPFPRPARRLPQEIPPLPPPSHRIGSGGTVPAAQLGCQSEPAAPPRSVRGPAPPPRARASAHASR